MVRLPGEKHFSRNFKSHINRWPAKRGAKWIYIKRCIERVDRIQKRKRKKERKKKNFKEKELQRQINDFKDKLVKDQLLQRHIITSKTNYFKG